MLIEQCVYANRWRAVTPAAKGLLALGALVAAFIVASRPAVGLLLAVLVATVPVVGAGVRAGHYARIAWPPLSFLLIGGLSMLVAVDLQQGSINLHLQSQHEVFVVVARSCGALAALLLLVTTTPLTDLIALLRRMKTPELLLDIMVLCYRVLFVFSESVHDMQTAQAARLGYADARRSLHSLGSLAANLLAQVWQRSRGLHQAALARNNDGPLRFLAPTFAQAGRHTAFAAIAALALVAASLWLRSGV
ncbi:MAG: cobalt ECF transporter T component CbiQ [Rhodocyclaceae bacterium]|nr:MAG: cobalt ECF transporter T component CbiQ [Rhodocyclaceae bacterium]